MALTRYAEQDLIPLIIGVLSFSAVRFAEYGFKGMMEQEISETPDFAEEDLEPELYFQVLASSTDELSGAFNRCIGLIDETIALLRIVYGIDLEELYRDERICALAGALFAGLYDYASGLIEEDISGAMREMPFSAANAFFFLCQLVIKGEIDTEQILEEGFYGDGAATYERMITSDRRVALIYPLIGEMLEMNIQITRLLDDRSRRAEHK